MNIEIANKLLQYRKKNNLSQEDLAEKIGVSRQAISKWERAEASPDTDNLILLAKLYGVTLDEMLSPEIEAKSAEEINDEKETKTASEAFDDAEKDFSTEEDDKKEKVHIGWKGIHVVDGEDEVHVGWNGIHVKSKDGEHVNIDSNGIIFNEENYGGHDWLVRILKSIPYSIIMVAVYLIMGFCAGLWHPGWLVFLTIPIFESVVEVIKKRNLNKFSMTMLCVTIYLYGGCVYNIWHPTWILFFAIPVYHSIFGAIHKGRKHNVSCDYNCNECNECDKW